MRGNCSWDTSFHFVGALVCQFKIVTRCHEFAPKPGTTLECGPSARLPCARLPARKICSSPEFLRSRRTVQIEYRFAASAHNMNVGRSMIVWINHNPQSIKPENRRHCTNPSKLEHAGACLGRSKATCCCHLFGQLGEQAGAPAFSHLGGQLPHGFGRNHRGPPHVPEPRANRPT